MEVRAAVKTAIRVGYRHIDCAAVYKNEKEVGEGIADAIRSGFVVRSDLWITSKLWNTNHHPSRVKPAIKQTLHDLRLDYIDLYLIHWPISFQSIGNETHPRKMDGSFELDDTPLEDTWMVMQNLVKEGLVRTLGVSNFREDHVDTLIAKTKIIPCVNQIENHPYVDERKLIQHCMGYGIQVQAYSPLGMGRNLKNKQSILLENDRVLEIAHRLRRDPAQILLRWNLQKGIVVLPKSVHPDRIQTNLQIYDFELTTNDIFHLDGLMRGLNGRLLRPDYAKWLSDLNEKD
eukprot:TRINITY_DN4628_c0_g1_i2.p1 TRINITY_DN4628_c0_g1~~TRINITY_DN4628_c0_g1_i2.p1  ORF type:complete len:289 (-),score=42.51 TRINITY_DN4628_c0_g1_i2:30-896(-)